jgi:VWFA-related protein
MTDPWFGWLSRFALVLLVSATAFATRKGDAFVDVVVRDSDGKFVAGLGRDDFTLLDGGAQENVGDVLSSLEGPSRDEPKWVALVFHGLGNQGRQFARQAAEDFFKALGDGAPNISVFQIDRRLYVLEPFSPDLKALDRSVRTATSGSRDQFVRRSQQVREELEAARESGKTFGEGEHALLDALTRTEQGLRDDPTHAALEGLNILVGELGSLQGRKMIVFFSEGLIVREASTARFDLLAGTSSLVNVPIYTVDARGLLAEGLTGESRAMLGSAAGASQSQFGTSAGTAWQVRALEEATQSVRMNAQETLARLAGGTGGFLLANTNDSRSGMTRMAEEVTSYYRLAYEPTQRREDGHFRQLEIKVGAANLRVQAPTGYVDLPLLADSWGAIATEYAYYELPLLAALSRETFDNPFEIELGMYRFEPGEAGIHHTILLQAPLGHFSFSENAEAGTYSTHFSMLALIKDGDGEIVAKVGQDYPVEGPLDRLDALKRGSVKFFETLELPPGDYTAEFAAIDHATNRVSSRSGRFSVPEASVGVRVGDLIVVGSVEPASGTESSGQARFVYQGQRLLPNLGKPLRRGPDNRLNLYATLYPDPNLSAEPTAALVFFSDGQPLFQGAIQVGQADEAGRIQVVLNLPMDNFPPGRYEIVLVAQQGDSVAEDRATFEVEP